MDYLSIGACLARSAFNRIIAICSIILRVMMREVNWLIKSWITVLTVSIAISLHALSALFALNLLVLR